MNRENLFISPSLPYAELASTFRRVKKVAKEDWIHQGFLSKRLGILSGATTEFTVPLIKLFGLKRDLCFETYASPYGTYESEIYSESLPLKDFSPEILFFDLVSQNLQIPSDLPNVFELEEAAKQEALRFANLLKKAQEQFHCLVITNNFVIPSEAPLGNFIPPLGKERFIEEVNRNLRIALPKGIVIHDVERLSSKYGKDRWFSPRLWHSAKVPMDLEALGTFADSLSALIGGAFGKSKKCLVLDLDNTLWGGVIGDDGLYGIDLNEGSARGEAFRHFQKYLIEFKNLGIVLGVCSKNEREFALEPFLKHEGMILREPDIACFKISWDRKDLALKEMALELNLGLDSFVFFDDNPAEQAIVRENLPEVTVIDVPEDPADFITALEAPRLFNAISLSAEDAQRTEQYRQNISRLNLERQAENYEDYLKRLSMEAICEPYNAENLSRVTQLINKTNQFNLTTQRLSEEEVRSKGEEAYTLAIRVKDKLGDHGLISAIHGSVENSILNLESWVMSCRVIKRDVEVFAFEQILGFCREKRIGQVRASYIPTTKNVLVKDLLSALGFSLSEQREWGTVWEFDVEKSTFLKTHFIRKSERTHGTA